MICPRCATENEPSARFCDACGNAFSRVCSNCGAQVRPGARFCANCGTVQTSEPSPTQTPSGPAAPSPAAAVVQPATTAVQPAAPAAPAVRADGVTAGLAADLPMAQPAAQPASQAERRFVSVLFVDLVGFTTLAEGRDPEEVRDLLTRYFDVARERIGRYGGTIEKFIGDAVMAVWGAPVAHEEDVERAVRAALELVEAVPGIAPGLVARAAVMSGEAVVTAGAADQGMIAGDLVNTASRLQSVAPPGSVLVGDATQRASAAAIAYEPAGEQVLRGKTSPVASLRALHVIADRGGRNRPGALEPAFIGRETESRLLRDLVAGARSQARPRLVSIIGEAGVGKSRLTWEVEHYAEGLATPVRWLVGRSPAFGEGVTFWALGEMVRQVLGLAESDDEVTVRARLAERLDALYGAAADRSDVEDALLALLGLGHAPSGGILFATWRGFFERLCADGPTVLVFEDLHAADPGLLDFIEHMDDWLRGPLVIVALARPEQLEARPHWASRRRAVTLRLEPLDDDRIRALIDGLVPGLPTDTIRAIVTRAGGFPLYAVELLRMFLADGTPAGRTGMPGRVRDLPSAQVPETLRALLAARLDAVEGVDRAVLEDAAVLGGSFTLEALAAVSATPRADLDRRVDGLVRREFLGLSSDPASPERGRYGWVQALVREVAYATLSRPNRRRRHLAAARYFESLADHELAGTTAGHYLGALRNSAGGPETDALAANVRASLRAAAERALDLGSPLQAAALLEQALEVATDPAERIDLLERTGGASSDAGRHDRAEGWFRQARNLAVETGDRGASARATAGLARALNVAGRHAEAAALAEAAESGFADMSDDPAVIGIGAQGARAALLAWEPRHAMEIADRILPAAERNDVVPAVAELLICKGSALAEMGRDREGAAVIRGGLDLALAAGLPRVALRGFSTLGDYLRSRDPRGALETARDGLSLARRLGVRQTVMLLVAADIAWELGEGDWSLQEMEEALAEELDDVDRARLSLMLAGWRADRGEDVAEPLGVVVSYASAHPDAQFFRAYRPALEGRISFLAGDLEAAYGKLTEANATTAETPSFIGFAYEMFRIALRLGDAERASGAAGQVLGNTSGDPVSVATRLTVRAGMAALEGRPGEAAGLYAQALDDWRRLGYGMEAAFVAIDMATVLEPGGEGVLAAAEEARASLVRAGARPHLEMLDRALRDAESAPAIARGA